MPRPWLLLTPALLVILLLFGGGLILAVLQSLGYLPFLGREELSLTAYYQLFGRATFGKSLLLTLWISLASTLFSTLLAVVAALSLRETFKGKRLFIFLFQLNLPIPHVVGAIAMLFLFSQSGLLARLAYAAGFIQEPSQFPALVYDPYGLGIILEYVWKTTCFTGVILLAMLHGVGDTYEQVAQTLGASPWQRFRYVTLPFLMPGILSSSVLVFAFTFGSFEVPFLLGQRANSALPVLAYRLYLDEDLATRPEAMALTVFISLVTAVFIWLYLYLTKKQHGSF